jgi:branched-chain amino acid transport system substrate-binding protein
LREVRDNKPLIKTMDGRQQNRETQMTRLTRRTILAAAPTALAAAALPARAAKRYGPGVTDTEIKIGNTGPYSGPLANASPIPLSMKAYFEMVNAQGGVNGRKIIWISYDDGYSPPKTVEITRKLVEEDQVLLTSVRWEHRRTLRFGTT